MSLAALSLRRIAARFNGGQSAREVPRGNGHFYFRSLGGCNQVPFQ
jgi:hypothetical protein